MHHHSSMSPTPPQPTHPQVVPQRRARRCGPTALTLIAAAIIIGGLIRLATDDRVVEVVSFREAVGDASSLAASLATNDD